MKANLTKRDIALLQKLVADYVGDRLSRPAPLANTPAKLATLVETFPQIVEEEARDYVPILIKLVS